MTSSQDAALAAALEHQYRQLAVFAARAERLRTLVPPPTSLWRGAAQRAFEAATQSIGTAVDETRSALLSAQAAMRTAIAEVESRA